jgi:hypothetical protein
LRSIARRHPGTNASPLALIFKGYLLEEDRDDAQAIKAAVEGVISDIAFDLQQETSTRSGSPL